MNFYKRFPGDYANDTRHLSYAEHGAYTLMMDLYYSTEKPLAMDRQELYRKLCAKTPEERGAIDNVLSQFFVAHAGRKKDKRGRGMHQKRIDEELASYKAYVKRSKLNGLKGGRPKPTKNQEGLFSKPTQNQNPEPESRTRIQNQSPNGVGSQEDKGESEHTFRGQPIKLSKKALEKATPYIREQHGRVP